MSAYRYVIDVTFSYIGDPLVGPESVVIGMYMEGCAMWPFRASISLPRGMVRWVAPPDEGLLNAVPKCEPPCDGMQAYIIFDIEPDRSLKPRSLFDLRIEWGDWWEDPDDELPIWRKTPRLTWHRRRNKRAKLFAEQTIWIQGKPVVIATEPLDARDKDERP